MAYDFDPAAVEAICRHMNDDHAADNLVIVQGATGRRFRSVRLVDCDAAGLRFDAEEEPGANGVPPTERVTVPWDRPIETRQDVRASVVALHERHRVGGGDLPENQPFG